jgi:hypothetical protein
MNIEELVIRAIDVLEKLNVPYMLTGSLANMLYMRARATADADFVVVMESVSVNDIARALGKSFKLDDQLTFETATMTSRFKFRHAESSFSIEFFSLSDDPHDQERFRRRCFVELYGRTVAVPTPEDAVVIKIRWLRNINRLKDRADALAIIFRQASRLDWPYVEKWCREHGTLDLLQQVRAEAAPPT